jgi:hypothetical protein
LKLKNIEQNTFQLIAIIPGQIKEAFIKYRIYINLNNIFKEEELKCVESQSQNNTECYFEPNFVEENAVIHILSFKINESQKDFYEILTNTLIPHPSKLIEFESKSNLDNTGVNLELKFNGKEQPIIEINDGTHKIIEYQNPIIFENIDNQNIYYFTFHYSSFSYEMTFDLHSSLLNKNFQKQNLRTLQDTCTHISSGSKSNVELIDFISSSRFGDPVGIHFQYNKIGSSEEKTYPIYYVVNNENLTFDKNEYNCPHVPREDGQSFNVTCYITTNEKSITISYPLEQIYYHCNHTVQIFRYNTTCANYNKQNGKKYSCSFEIEDDYDIELIVTNELGVQLKNYSNKVNTKLKKKINLSFETTGIYRFEIKNGSQVIKLNEQFQIFDISFNTKSEKASKAFIVNQQLFEFMITTSPMINIISVEFYCTKKRISSGSQDAERKFVMEKKNEKFNIQSNQMNYAF